MWTIVDLDLHLHITFKLDHVFTFFQWPRRLQYKRSHHQRSPQHLDPKKLDKASTCIQGKEVDQGCCCSREKESHRSVTISLLDSTDYSRLRSKPDHLYWLIKFPYRVDRHSWVKSVTGRGGWGECQVAWESPCSRSTGNTARTDCI